MPRQRSLPIPGLLAVGVVAFTLILIITILGAKFGSLEGLLKTGVPLP